MTWCLYWKGSDREDRIDVKCTLTLLALSLALSPGLALFEAKVLIGQVVSARQSPVWHILLDKVPM